MVTFSRTILLCCLSFASASSSVHSSVVTPLDGHLHNHIATSETTTTNLALPRRSSPTTAFTRIRGGDLAKSLQLGTKSAVGFGMLLALNSGCVNGICLSGLLAHDGTKQASAAVTGAWTNSALGVATGNNNQFAFNAKCILSYMTGSLIASINNPDPVPWELNNTGVSVAFGVGAALLFASSRSVELFKDMRWLYLAAVANGIQNSVTSVVTANMVRSAHFSGITSDIGTFLGQVLRGNTKNLMKLQVMSLLATSFWVGGFGSYYMTKQFGSKSLLFSAGLYMAIAIGIILKALNSPESNTHQD